MKITSKQRAQKPRRGSATVIAVMAVVVLSIFCGAILMSTLHGKGERKAVLNRHQALLAADSGIAEAVSMLTAGAGVGMQAQDVLDIGTDVAPLDFGGGDYWAQVLANGDDTFLVTSMAFVHNELEAIEARLEPVGGGIYDNAIFAGNTSDDPLYELELGGSGLEADQIGGDVYSGNDVAVTGDATVAGDIRAEGDVTGAPGEEGVSQPIPDLAGMNYENSADFDVAAMFDADGYYAGDNAGGFAYQLDESNPAHIFRKNPNDRSSNINSTEKADYFLEDPYEPVNSDSSQDGSNPYPITVSGITGEPGPNGNHKVYYIDGNLWIHNKRTYSFMFEHNEPNGVQVTFVVKGNIYMSDNLFLADPVMDGVALIAMVDDNVADSGNIYFGDPEFGTLVQMSAFMYAENNFYDYNLDDDESAVVTLNGNMTAGNQVVIQRDWEDHHTKLVVNYDDRISVGDLSMPGLPSNSGAGPDKYVVTYWHQIAEQ